MASGEKKPFELKPEEIAIKLTFREGGKLAVEHVCRPPKLDDWLAWDTALQHARERDAKGLIRWQDHREEAAEALWDRIALRVGGYWSPASSASVPLAQGAAETAALPQSSASVPLAEGAAETAALPQSSASVPLAKGAAETAALPPDWKSRVPASHKYAAIGVFENVHTMEESEEAAAFSESEITVRLAAQRGEIYHENLTHRFRRPKAADKSRWRYVHAGSYVQQDRNVERTLMPSRLKAQCEFYDEFLLGVSGYALDGKTELTREEALAAMDAWHKSTAVREAFSL